MDRIIYTVHNDDRKVVHATFSKDDAHAAARHSGTVSPVVLDPDIAGKVILERMNPVERLCVQFPDITEDTIVYVTVSNGGGVDGRDPSDRRGTIRYASFHKDIAEKKVDGWSHLGDPFVVVPADVVQETLSKLNPVETLCLETHLDNLRAKHTTSRPKP